MKNFVFLFISILGILSSCKEDFNKQDDLVKTFDQATFPQKWVLVSMKGNIANVPPVKGKDMEFQEFYILNTDSTFSKTRERNGVSQTVRGMYVITNKESMAFLTLTHESESGLIGNCFATLDEELVLQDDNAMISTWQACDGPGLVYNRKD